MNSKYREIDKRFNSLIEKAKRKIDFESGINKKIYTGDTGTQQTYIGHTSNPGLQILNRLDRLTDKNKELEKLEQYIYWFYNYYIRMSSTLFEISNEMKKSIYNQTEKLCKIDNIINLCNNKIIATIEDNIINTDTYVIKANKEIDITAESQTSCTSLCKWLLFLVGLLVFVGCLVVYYFVWKDPNIKE